MKRDAEPGVGEGSAPSEPIYKALAEAMPQLVWIAGDDGAVWYYNERVSLYHGITAGPDGTWSWAPVLHPDDDEPTRHAWSEALANQRDYECEHRLCMADGSYRWHISRALPMRSSDGETVTWFGTATDIHARKLVEAALQESESRLRAVFSSIDQGYCLCELVFDAEGQPVDYRFLETNPLFEEATGLIDATGRCAYELLPDLEPHWLQTYAQVALDGSSLRFEQGSAAMGRWFDIFVTGVAPVGRFAIVFSDVTARRAAEEALRESESRFRNLADNAPVMIWVTERDGLCSYLSKRWYDFTGQTTEAGLGLGWLDAAHPDDRHRVEAVFHERAERREGFRIEYRLRRHDGEYRWVLDAAVPRFEPDGAFLGFIGSVIDISDRKQSEDLLRRRHQEQRHLALRLQRALLPGKPVEHPDFDIATSYVAATGALEVGGDWYETHLLSDGRLGLAVGDVVGHNIEAAAAMGQLRSGFLALATFADGPGELLRGLDVFTRAHGITDMATVCCAFIDPKTDDVAYTSAGHPPMLMVPETGDAVWLDGGRSVPLGVGEVSARPDATIAMRPGALLVAYSDGLVERRRQPIDHGLDRLRALVESLRHLPVDDLCQRVLETMADDVGFDDDIVVVCLRRRKRG